jgi:hypothetical protein
MIILYGTKQDTTIEPVAVFTCDSDLARYVNALCPRGTQTLDNELKAKSILAKYTDHQSKTVEQIWESCEDWKEQLEAAKLCVRDPK